MKNEILDKLWKIKKEKNLSDKELEKELFVDRMQIYRWRKGKTSPSPLAMREIKKFLKKMSQKCHN